MLWHRWGFEPSWTFGLQVQRLLNLPLGHSTPTKLNQSIRSKKPTCHGLLSLLSCRSSTTVAQDKEDVVAVETQDNTRRGALACVQFSFIMADSSVSPRLTKKEINLMRIDIIITIKPELSSFSSWLVTSAQENAKLKWELLLILNVLDTFLEF